jgi:pilus assembly protein Flp/PilA
VIVVIKIFNRLIKEEKGQGLVEYALILVLVSVAAIAIMTSLGDNNKARMNEITNTLPPEGL